MTDIKFLGEDDFLSAMENENKAWFEKEAVSGTHESFDGTRLRYFTITPDNPKACIVVVHGMAEFIGKYREYLWYLYRAGYKVFFMEQRGHGYSEGKCPEADVIYIDSYETYVKDLHHFIKAVVEPDLGDLPLFMIAHSMGGCTGALYLEEHPETFKAAILSSPMMKMKGADYPAILVTLIGLYAKLTGKSKKLAPNQKHFDPTVTVTNSSAISAPRFEFQLSMRRADEHYQTCGASFGWAVASMKASRKAVKNAGKIKIPLTVMTAGCDHLIDPAGYEAFKEKVPAAVFHHYEKSRHEIFNADEITRKQYFTDVLTTLDKYLNNAK
ncbi:alpha/beta fold hydrolase [Butyrivibrio sp. FCS006]|uniref:alpha/beta fold hydrolase n=1 Tax=Butyrivibrio sp. FCS006 TaxID=1280684 RepID=UPI00041DE3E4|nr:alpha/beta fold hydrolase [Butyrivibrio sp. FCS006]